MHKLLMLGVLFVLLVACVRPPQYVVCSCAAPSLGIATDEALRVTSVTPDLPAERANVQIGDVLVDLRPAIEHEGISNETVQFTDSDAVNELIWYSIPDPFPKPGECCISAGIPLILRVERGDEVVEIEISSGYVLLPTAEAAPVATAQGSPLATPTAVPRPTATPIPTGGLYF